MAVAAFVVAGGFAGAAVQPYLMDRAAVATKLTIARTAADAISTLWSYTPENMDKLPTGPPDTSAATSRSSTASTSMPSRPPTNRPGDQRHQGGRVAVESLRGNDATAIVYTNTTSSTPQSNNIPSMKYLSTGWR